MLTWVRARTATSALVVADVAVLAACSRPALAFLRHPAAPARLGADALAADLAQLGLAVAAAWLAVGLLAGALAVLPGLAGRTARRVHVVVVPAFVRRVIAGGAGASVLLAPATAIAAPPAAASQARVVVTACASVTPAGWSASPAPVPPPVWPTSTDPSPHQPAASGRVTVARGDSLWLIAARRLGAREAGHDADVAAYWPQIYRDNRAVIGDDPDLIRPGQSLRLPTPTVKEPRP